MSGKTKTIFNIGKRTFSGISKDKAGNLIDLAPKKSITLSEKKADYYLNAYPRDISIAGIQNSSKQLNKANNELKKANEQNKAKDKALEAKDEKIKELEKQLEEKKKNNGGK